MKHFIEPLLHRGRTKEILKFNPATPLQRKEPNEVKLCVFHYDASTVEKANPQKVEDTFHFKEGNKIIWINIDGLSRHVVEKICAHYEIHPLIVENILSIGQRPKMDDIEGRLYCLMNMLYFNDETCAVEQEQISMVLGKNFLITFQEDANRDVFDSIRNKLQLASSKLRLRSADFYFIVC